MKKHIKLMILTVLSALLISLLPTNFASAQATEEQDVTIGFVISDLNDVFLNYILNATVDAAEEKGYVVEVADAQSDLIQQQDHVNSFIQKGVDVIIVNPVDTSAMMPISDAAVSAGIPLIYINRNPTASHGGELPEGVYFVGPDESKVGVLQAENTARLLNNEGNVVILLGTLGHESTATRTQGVKSVLEENFPDITILAEETADYQRDQGVTVTENLLSAYGDQLNAIISNNDEMALGALQALESAGRDDVIVMGVDASEDALQAIKEGKLTATVSQDAVGQGKGAIEIVHALMSGEPVEKNVEFLEGQYIDASNVDDFSLE